MPYVMVVRVRNTVIRGFLYKTVFRKCNANFKAGWYKKPENSFPPLLFLVIHEFCILGNN